MVNIYQDAKRLGIYPRLFTDPEGDSCFSIYQIRCVCEWILREDMDVIVFWLKYSSSSISHTKGIMLDM